MDWLNEADSRYYSLRHTPRNFPVARLRFADANQSVFYIAPDSGRIVLTANRHDSAQRWLFRALHRLDIAPLVAQPWLHDGITITLCLLGGGLSLSGCILGWRRLRQARTQGKKAGQKWSKRMVKKGSDPHVTSLSVRRTRISSLAT